MLGHFPSANQQNFSKATGSMQKALGANVKIDFISVFLATHIAVMTARPGRIKAAFRSPFNETEDPLVAATPAFTAAKRQIVELLRAESRQAQAQESAA